MKKTYTFKDTQGQDHYVHIYPEGDGVYNTEILRSKFTIKKIGKIWSVACDGVPDPWVYPTFDRAITDSFNYAVDRIRVVLPYGTVCRLTVSLWEQGVEVSRTIGIFINQQEAEKWRKDNPEFQIGWNINKPLVLKDARVFYIHHVINRPDVSVW